MIGSPTQRRWPAAIIFVGVLLAASPVAAQSGAARERLEVLQEEIERLEVHAGRLDREKSAIWAELARLTTRRDLMQARAAAAVETLQRLDRAAIRAEAAARQADLRAKRTSAALTRQLRAMRRGQHGLLQAALLAADDPAATVETLRRLADRAALDRAVIESARASRERAVQAAMAAARGRVEVETARHEARAAEDRAAEAVVDRQRRLDQVRDQEELFARAMDELERTAAALADFVAGKAGRTPPGPDPRRLQGTLPWPTAGPVRTPFGPRRHPRFGTTVPHNGIDIDAGPGTPVHATADGTVLYADWFQSYGRTVIIDHGSGLITVSSRLGSIAVVRDQTVGMGELVGTVGDSGTPDDVHLYFEVRDQGRPVQPLDWLRPRR